LVNTYLIFKLYFYFSFFFFVADEIANAISGPIIGQTDLYNDADLEKELQDLADEEDSQIMLNIGPLPDVPKSKTKEKDDPLRELEAWAV